MQLGRRSDLLFHDQARRLIVDYKLGDPYTRPTHDGRYLLRYHREHRAFELVEVGTGEVRRLTADGPNPAQAVVGASELSSDGRRLAAIIRLRASSVMHTRTGVLAILLLISVAALTAR